MTEPTTSDEIPEPLGPDGGELAALGDLLASPVVWDQPAADIAGRVVDGIGAESGYVERAAALRPGHSERRYLKLIGVVAALFLVVGVGLALLLADDDPTSVALAGTELVPEASAVAELEDTPQGLEVRLDVTGLPPAGPGTYYQGWVQNDVEGISIGTFHMRGGDAALDLWAGVSSDDYPVITITLQQVGDGPASSGVVVMKGVIGE